MDEGLKSAIDLHAELITGMSREDLERFALRRTLAVSYILSERTGDAIAQYTSLEEILDTLARDALRRARARSN